MAMVIALVGLTAGIAAPRYARSMARYRATAAANRLVADLALARAAARTGSGDQPVDFTAPVVGYTLSGMKDPDRPGLAYVVDLTLPPYEVTGLTATLTSTAGQPVSAVTFDRFGAPNAGGPVVVQAGDVQKTVFLDVKTGRATVQ